MDFEHSRPEFSIVIPVFNEKENLKTLHQEIISAMKKKAWTFEIIFVDDGSTDGSKDALTDIQNEDSRVYVSTFRKNRGKSAALAAGFERVRGKYVMTLDGDLQDNPREISRLFPVMTNHGADLVCGWKKIRRDPLSKIISSRLFNAAVRFLTGVKLHDFNCGIKLFRAEVVDEIPMYGELHRFIPALAAWRGFFIMEKPVRHRPRTYGKSKYGMGRMFGALIDLSTIVFIMRYENKPSHLFSGFGATLLIIGCVINVHLLIIKLLGHTIYPRYPYMILGILSLVVGIQFIFFGLLSEMMVHISKSRETLGHHEERT